MINELCDNAPEWATLLKEEEENLLFAYVKTKAQISCAVAPQLIIAFVFAK